MSTLKFNPLFNRLMTRKEFLMTLGVVAISVIPMVEVIRKLSESSAASPNTSGEAENGTLSGSTAFTDPNASGGSAVRFGSPPTTPTTSADLAATKTTVNLLTLLRSMPSRGQVIVGQQFGAQSYPPYNFYDADILSIKNGSTESDAGGSVTVPATNKLPGLMNFDLSFLLTTGAPTYSTQTPASVRLSDWSGVANGYGEDNVSIDGAIANFQAGSLVSLTYHFDNPLTGGIFYDLGNQSGLNLSATTTVTTATTTAAIGSTIGNYNGSLNVANASGFTNPAGLIQVATSPVSLTASAASSTTTVLGCKTATLTLSSVSQVAVGQTVSGSGITGSVYVSAVTPSTNTVTLTAWNSPTVPGSISSLSAGSYTFSGYALIQYKGVSSTQFSQCLVVSGAGTIATGATVTTPQCGAMTSSFFSDPNSQAYANFNNTTNGMLNSVIQFCLALQNASPSCSVIYRPLHEPNGNWFWWGQGGNGTPGTGAPWYAAAYAFIQQQLWKAGAHNVLFVWGPIRSDGSGTAWSNADMTSYPGDNVVDIAGVDMYGEDPTDGSMQASQAAIYAGRGWNSTNQKPFAIFEFGWYNNFNTGGVGQGNATIYSSGNTSGELYTKDNMDIITGLNMSTAGTIKSGPAYFMSWGQVWAIRLQNNFYDFYTNSKIATQSDLQSYKWNS